MCAFLSQPCHPDEQNEEGSRRRKPGCTRDPSLALRMTTKGVSPDDKAVVCEVVQMERAGVKIRQDDKG